MQPPVRLHTSVGEYQGAITIGQRELCQMTATAIVGVYTSHRSLFRQTIDTEKRTGHIANYTASR